MVTIEVSPYRLNTIISEEIENTLDIQNIVGDQLRRLDDPSPLAYTLSKQLEALDRAKEWTTRLMNALSQEDEA